LKTHNFFFEICLINKCIVNKFLKNRINEKSDFKKIELMRRVIGVVRNGIGDNEFEKILIVKPFNHALLVTWQTWININPHISIKLELT
jgi:hypothetical protein